MPASIAGRAASLPKSVEPRRLRAAVQTVRPIASRLRLERPRQRQVRHHVLVGRHVLADFEADAGHQRAALRALDHPTEHRLQLLGIGARTRKRQEAELGHDVRDASATRDDAVDPDLRLDVLAQRVDAAVGVQHAVQGVDPLPGVGEACAALPW